MSMRVVTSGLLRMKLGDLRAKLITISEAAPAWDVLRVRAGEVRSRISAWFLVFVGCHAVTA